MRSKHIFWMMIALAIGMIIGASRGALAQTGDERADQWARENPELAIITEWVAELEDQIYELEQEVSQLEQEIEDLQEVNLSLWWAIAHGMSGSYDLLAIVIPEKIGDHLSPVHNSLVQACQNMPEEHRQQITEQGPPCPETADE